MALFFAGQLAQFAHSHTVGGGIANRAIRSRIAANNRRDTATSASWNVTYLACRVTLAPILTSLSRNVVSEAQWQRSNEVLLPTIPVGEPKRQIDFILYRPAPRWKVMETRVLEEAVASDHRAVFCVLELLPE
jgi:hypothetical protein